MPPSQLDDELRVRARARIRDGRLRCIPGHRTWGGRGSNQPCALCDAPIRDSEVEYEIEGVGIDSPGPYRFHFLCHDAWQFECAQET